MRDLWEGLPAATQDALLLAALLTPGLIVGALTLRGFAPWPLVVGMLRRHAGVCAAFCLLIAISVAIGAGLTAQERGLREGSALAADKFDLVVSAPGSEVAAMLAVVFLQPTDMALIDGLTLRTIAKDERVSFAAPLAFGDSYESAPVVGATNELVTHLASGTMAEGRSFETHFEAIAGARVPLGIGDSFTPTHGSGQVDFRFDVHEGVEFRIVGRLPRTGGPWDRALIVPIEDVWRVHGLADGHRPHLPYKLGPPFDPDYFPGAAAIVVRADAIWANYALRADYTTSRTMAFFPGEVLAGLHTRIGDVREAMSALALATQILVAVGILAGLVILMRLTARGFALLRALGAPRRFIFAVAWGFGASLISVGAVLGLGLGLVAVRIFSAVVEARTDVAVNTDLGWPELHAAAAFISLAVVLALVPAWLAVRRPTIADLRA